MSGGLMDDNEYQELQDEIYEEVLAERRYQDEVWHGQQNSPDVWSDLMAEYAMGCTDRTKDYDDRTRWLKVAALGFAAIEAYDTDTLVSESVNADELGELFESISELVESVNTMISMLSELFGFDYDDDDDDDEDYYEEDDYISDEMCEDCAFSNFCSGDPSADDCFVSRKQLYQ